MTLVIDIKDGHQHSEIAGEIDGERSKPRPMLPHDARGEPRGDHLGDQTEPNLEPVGLGRQR